MLILNSIHLIRSFTKTFKQTFKTFKNIHHCNPIHFSLSSEFKINHIFNLKMLYCLTWDLIVFLKLPSKKYYVKLNYLPLYILVSTAPAKYFGKQ